MFKGLNPGGEKRKNSTSSISIQQSLGSWCISEWLFQLISLVIRVLPLSTGLKQEQFYVNITPVEGEKYDQYEYQMANLFKLR